jgi:hypothetical protein
VADESGVVTHPLRFGVQTGQQMGEWPQMLDLWRKADSWGYDSLWNFDHFYRVSGPPDQPCLEGWTSLAALAQGVSRLARAGRRPRLGSGRARERTTTPETRGSICLDCPALLDWHRYVGHVGGGGRQLDWMPAFDSNQRYNYFWSRAPHGRALDGGHRVPVSRDSDTTAAAPRTRAVALEAGPTGG